MTADPRDAVSRVEFVDSSSCEARQLLDMVADKWSLYVVAVLGARPSRFTEIKRSIGGISQRMLTVTLRRLERDGILTRTVLAVMPPNVTYELTPMGHTLLDAVEPIIEWSMSHLDEIAAAQQRFDRASAHG